MAGPWRASARAGPRPRRPSSRRGWARSRPARRRRRRDGIGSSSTRPAPWRDGWRRCSIGFRGLRRCPPMRMRQSDARVPSVLVLFNTVALYGMERGVIEYFDLIRSELRAVFLVSRTVERLNLPVLHELRRRGFDVRFFSDRRDWPKIGRPRSLRHFGALAAAMLRGNRDVLRAARGHDALYVPSTSYLFFALAAAPWFRLTGRRVIYHFHDLAPHPRWLLRAAGPFVTDVIHNTEAGREQATAQFRHLARARQLVVPYPIERRDGALPPALEEALDGALNVVYIGQVSKHKGVDLLVDAFVAAAPGTPARLHVLGAAA